MDIKNLTTGAPATRANDAVKVPTRDVDSGKQASSPTSDRVTLTDALSQVRELESISQDVNIDNSARIASLKAAIQDGSYQVDAQRIADKLIQTEALFAKV